MYSDSQVVGSSHEKDLSCCSAFPLIRWGSKRGRLEKRIKEIQAMQPVQPVHFYVPKNFDPTIFKPDLRDDAHYLLNLLHWKWLNWRYDQDDDEFVHLNHKLLAEYMDKSNVRPVLEALSDHKIIKVNRDFWPGKYSRGYKLTPDHYKTRMVLCEKESLSKKIRKAIREMEERLLPVHWWLKDEGLSRLEIDLRRARKIIPTLFPDPDEEEDIPAYRTRLLSQCEHIHNKEFLFTRDKYGRVHSEVTRLPKELRCCLSFEGEPAIMLDLKNSQPLIAGIAAMRYFSSKMGRHRFLLTSFDKDRKNPYCYKAISEICKKGINLPEDAKEYILCCEEGRFYESLMTDNLSREEIKLKVYKKVFFGRPQQSRGIAQQFSERFPSIAEMLIAFKKGNYKRSAWFLQNIEATIFIHNICGRIKEENPKLPVVTIHDCLMVPRKSRSDVKEVILQEFQQFGVRPKLHEEDLS